MYEDAIHKRYENLKRKNIIRQWLSGIFICCKFCKNKAKNKKGKRKDDENLEAVNVLRDKMRS